MPCILDLFSLPEPNDDFEFHWAMKSLFLNARQKITTKCIKVSSTTYMKAVKEKFHPNMQMLQMTEYTLYEIHPNCDGREDRFLLRRAYFEPTLTATQPLEESSFRRKLSKLENCNTKKENKFRKFKSSADHAEDGNVSGRDGGANNNQDSTELPETRFTRSTSNPEAVMMRRRQLKLERKLKLLRFKDCGPNTDGSLKI